MKNPSSPAGDSRVIVHETNKTNWLLYGLGIVTGVLLAGATMDFYIDDDVAVASIEPEEENQEVLESDKKGYNSYIMDATASRLREEYREAYDLVLEDILRKTYTDLQAGDFESSYSIWASKLDPFNLSLSEQKTLASLIVNDLRLQGFDAHINQAFGSGGRTIYVNLEKQ